MPVTRWISRRLDNAKGLNSGLIDVKPCGADGHGESAVVDRKCVSTSAVLSELGFEVVGSLECQMCGSTFNNAVLELPLENSHTPIG